MEDDPSHGNPEPAYSLSEHLRRNKKTSKHFRRKDKNWKQPPREHYLNFILLRQVANRTNPDDCTNSPVHYQLQTKRLFLDHLIYSAPKLFVGGMVILKNVTTSFSLLIVQLAEQW